MPLFSKLPPELFNIFKDYILLHNERVVDYYSLIMAGSHTKYEDKESFFGKHVILHDFDKFSRHDNIFTSYAAKFVNKNFGFEITPEESKCIERNMNKHKSSSPHHPEFFKDSFGICNLSAMQYWHYAEMVADCAAVAEEKGKVLKPWFDEFFKNKSISASPYSKEVIYGMTHILEKDIAKNIVKYSWFSCIRNRIQRII